MELLEYLVIETVFDSFITHFLLLLMPKRARDFTVELHYISSCAFTFEQFLKIYRSYH